MLSTKTYVLLGLCLILVGGCSKWSTSSIDPNTRLAGKTKPATDPSKVRISQNDITNRPYQNLGDIEVVVNKTSIFNSDPTRKDVDEELRKKAASIGADAVVLVRYGTVGVSFMSWGSLDGKGRAIAFK